MNACLPLSLELEFLQRREPLEQVRSNKHDMSGYSGNRENKEKHGVSLDWCIKAHK
jgi:hypothetical protein